MSMFERLVPNFVFHLLSLTGAVNVVDSWLCSVTLRDSFTDHPLFVRISFAVTHYIPSSFADWDFLVALVGFMFLDDWKAVGRPMHGLADSSWLGWWCIHALLAVGDGDVI